MPPQIAKRADKAPLPRWAPDVRADGGGAAPLAWATEYVRQVEPAKPGRAERPGAGSSEAGPSPDAAANSAAAAAAPPALSPEPARFDRDAVVTTYRFGDQDVPIRDELRAALGLKCARGLRVLCCATPAPSAST